MFLINQSRLHHTLQTWAFARNYVLRGEGQQTCGKVIIKTEYNNKKKTTYDRTITTSITDEAAHAAELSQTLGEGGREKD